MNPENTNDASTLPARYARLIQVQRTAIAVLLLALVSLAMYVKVEQRQVDVLRTETEYLRTRIQGQPRALIMPSTPSAEQTIIGNLRSEDSSGAGYYPVELIGEDNSPVPLKGKALRIDLGKERILQVFLNRQPKDRLLIWAPAKRENKFFNTLAFHAMAANTCSLDLERFDTGSADTVSYSEPK